MDTEKEAPRPEEQAQAQDQEPVVTAEDLAAAHLEASGAPAPKEKPEAESVKAEIDRMRAEIEALRMLQSEHKARNEQLMATIRNQERQNKQSKKGSARRSSYFEEAEEPDEASEEAARGSVAGKRETSDESEKDRFDRMYLDRQIKEFCSAKAAEIEAISKLDPAFSSALALAIQADPVRAFDLLKSKVTAYDAAKQKKSVQARESIRPRMAVGEPSGRRVTKVDGNTSHADFLIFLEEEAKRLEDQFYKR